MSDEITAFEKKLYDLMGIPTSNKRVLSNLEMEDRANKKVADQLKSFKLTTPNPQIKQD